MSKEKILEGILQKEQKGLLGTSQWKHYLYVIKEHFLMEYRANANVEKEEQLAITDLRNCQVEVLDSEIGNCCFSVTSATQGKRSLFRCPTEITRGQWLKALANFQAPSSASPTPSSSSGQLPRVSQNNSSGYVPRRNSNSGSSLNSTKRSSVNLEGRTSEELESPTGTKNPKPETHFDVSSPSLTSLTLIPKSDSEDIGSYNSTSSVGSQKPTQLLNRKNSTSSSKSSGSESSFNSFNPNLPPSSEEDKDTSTLVTPQAVLASLPDLESFLTAVVIGSIHGIIIGCNTMAEQLFGYTKEEMINQPVTILMPEPHRSRHDAYLFRHEKFGTENLMGKPRQLEGMTKEGIVFPIILSLGKLHIDGYYLACFIQMPNAP